MKWAVAAVIVTFLVLLGVRAQPGLTLGQATIQTAHMAPDAGSDG